MAWYYVPLPSLPSFTGKTNHDLETSNWSVHIDMPVLFLTEREYKPDKIAV